jgi:hypothetical protein
MAYSFEIKGVYNFDVYPTAILGDDFDNVTILAILDYETALQTADIPAIHTNVFPYLPSGIPDDPSQYDYVRIRTASGSATILGIPWINLDTLELVESRRMTVKIEGVSSSDVERVRIALVQNGFNNLEITLN